MECFWTKSFNKALAKGSIIAGVGLVLMSCGGGSGTGGGGGGPPSQDIVRSFSSGASPVEYTAVVHQPRNSNASQFVVAPISSQSAFQYFNQNISQAITSHASLVSFPIGSYSIAPEGENRYHIVISGASDLTIDGQGSTLTFSGVQGGDAQGTIQGIELRGSSRIVLKNFIIDYDVRIASSGTVQSESAHCGGLTHRYAAIDTATYPMTDVRIQQAKIFNDSTSDLWGIRAHEYYTYTSPVNLQGGNAFYPCSSAFDSAFPTVGHTVTMRHFAYDGNAIAIYGPNAQDITLQNMTIYASPGIGVYVGSSFSRGVAIENVKIVKNPGDSTRLISLAADGLHFDNLSGDIIVENSEISFQGDDGLNIVTSIPDSTTVSGNDITIPSTGPGTSGTSAYSVGDVFSFYGTDFSYLGTATLQSLTKGTSIAATFTPLPGVSNGSYILDQSQSAARIYISGNSFHDNRERGIITRATGVWVENNSFVNNSGPAILLGTDGIGFMEGAFARDVTLSGNTITAANQTQVSKYTYTMEFGAISVGVDCPTASGCNNTLSPNSLIQNLLIQNNTVSASAGIGMLLSNLDTASVNGNTVVDTSSTVQQSAFGGIGSAAGSIHYTRSTGVAFDANTLSRPVTNN